MDELEKVQRARAFEQKVLQLQRKLLFLQEQSLSGTVQDDALQWVEKTLEGFEKIADNSEQQNRKESNTQESNTIKPAPILEADSNTQDQWIWEAHEPRAVSARAKPLEKVLSKLQENLVKLTQEESSYLDGEIIRFDLSALESVSANNLQRYQEAVERFFLMELMLSILNDQKGQELEQKANRFGLGVEVNISWGEHFPKLKKALKEKVVLNIDDLSREHEKQKDTLIELHAELQSLGVLMTSRQQDVLTDLKEKGWMVNKGENIGIYNEAVLVKQSAREIEVQKEQYNGGKMFQVNELWARWLQEVQQAVEGEEAKPVDLVCWKASYTQQEYVRRQLDTIARLSDCGAGEELVDWFKKMRLGQCVASVQLALHALKEKEVKSFDGRVLKGWPTLDSQDQELMAVRDQAVMVLMLEINQSISKDCWVIESAMKEHWKAGLSAENQVIADTWLHDVIKAKDIGLSYYDFNDYKTLLWKKTAKAIKKMPIFQEQVKGLFGEKSQLKQEYGSAITLLQSGRITTQEMSVQWNSLGQKVRKLLPGSPSQVDRIATEQTATPSRETNGRKKFNSVYRSR